MRTNLSFENNFVCTEKSMEIIAIGDSRKVSLSLCTKTKTYFYLLYFVVEMKRFSIIYEFIKF